MKFNGDALELSRLSLKPWYGIGAVTRPFHGSRYLFLKRIIDISFSFFSLLAVVPIILLCTVLIKLESRGPCFYLQERTGKGGKRFKMYKLRTMVQDADALKKKFSYLNEKKYPDFKIVNDPRVTKIGRILRKTSLDEIPQFLNVLKGDMSLVGPRPTSFSADTYDLWHTARLEIKPGITGLWQVSGRSNLDFNERNRLDIAYWQNFSLWLDLKIMFRTIGCVFNGHGAE